MNDVEHAIEIRGLALRYGRKAVLSGLALDVPAGTTTVLLGANGEGKTTLLNVCLGVLPAQAGHVAVLGCDPVRAAAALRPRVGYVPSTPDAYGWMKVLDLFRFLHAHYATWDEGRALSLAQRLDVPLRTKFRQLSRGQGMKAMLVAALAPGPEVLLLDEPFGGLDPLVREEVLRNVINAIGETPRTVLLATHDLDVAARVADRIALLSEGRVMREGPVEDFASENEESTTPLGLRTALAGVVKGVA